MLETLTPSEKRLPAIGEKPVYPYLQLGEGEATAETSPAVVLDGAVMIALDDPIPRILEVIYQGSTNGHLTIGRSLSTGRGATAAALARRAKRRVIFLPAYIPSNMSEFEFLEIPPLSLRMSAWLTNLVEVAPHTSLPILAEICDISVSFAVLFSHAISVAL